MNTETRPKAATNPRKKGKTMPKSSKKLDLGSRGILKYEKPKTNNDFQKQLLDIFSGKPVQEIEGDGVSREIPPLIAYNEADNTIYCNNDDVLALIQAVTNGDPVILDSLINRSKPLRKRLLRDTEGQIRVLLMAKCYKEMLKGGTERDPFDWALLLIELIKYENVLFEKQQRAYQEKKKGVKPRDDKPRESKSTPDEEAEEAVRQVLRMVGEGEGT